MSLDRRIGYRTELDIKYRTELKKIAEEVLSTPKGLFNVYGSWMVWDPDGFEQKLAEEFRKKNKPIHCLPSGNANLDLTNLTRTSQPPQEPQIFLLRTSDPNNPLSTNQLDNLISLSQPPHKIIIPSPRLITCHDWRIRRNLYSMPTAITGLRFEEIEARFSKHLKGPWKDLTMALSVPDAYNIATIVDILKYFKFTLPVKQRRFDSRFRYAKRVYQKLFRETPFIEKLHMGQGVG